MKALGALGLKDDIKNMGKDRIGAKQKEEGKRRAKMTKEERERETKKKKERILKNKRMLARDNAKPEKKLDSVVRAPRDAKEKLRMERAREDLKKFIKEQII